MKFHNLDPVIVEVGLARLLPGLDGSVHEEGAVKVPDPLLVKLTVPSGVLLPVPVLVTVAVQVLELPIPTDEGEQLTEVLVVLAASLNAVCAVKPEDWPIAVSVNILSRSIN